MTIKQRTLKTRLLVDPEKVSGNIVSFVRDKVEKEHKDGVLLGLSGGIDSAVVVTLASLAVGPEKVHTMHLFDRDSDKKSLEYARMVATKLGIHFEAHNISKLAVKMGLSKPQMVSPFPPAINRMFHRMVRSALRRVTKEEPFVLVLKQAEPSGVVARMLYRAWVRRTEVGFNSKHKLRRAILEARALRENLLLVGAANKTEAMVGWFVKDGVDDLPLEPIMGLYKTQVRQLAGYLKVHQEIIDITPSPDMTRGITDEMVIGFSYEKLDTVLYVIENGLKPEVAYEAGITPEEFEGIKRLNTLSAWKRANPHEYPILS